jgi:hypothetical protein
MNKIEDKIIVRGICGAYVGESIYIYSKDVNLIYSLNIKTGEYHVFKGRKLSEKIIPYFSHGAINNKDDIYFLPGVQNRLIKFSTVTHSVNEIEISKDIFMNNQMIYTANAIIYKNQLVLLPINIFKKIPYINLLNDTVVYRDFNGWNGRFSNGQVSDIGFSFGMVLHNNFLYRVCKLMPFIIKYDLETGDTKWIEIEGVSVSPRGIVCDECNYWIIYTQSSLLTKWNGNSFETIDLSSYIDDYIQAINYYNKKIYISFSNRPCILIVNLEQDTNNIDILDCNKVKGFTLHRGIPFADNMLIGEKKDVVLLTSIIL